MFVRCTLQGWLLGDLVEDAELIVSELVTNAVAATGITAPGHTYADLHDLSLIAVQVRVTGDSVFVEVWDDNSDEPTMCPDDESDVPTTLTASDEDGLAEGGRGLLIVRELSKGFGVTTLARNGKIVWAELDAGHEIARVPQMELRPLPAGFRQVMLAPSRQPPQHAMADVALYRHASW